VSCKICGGPTPHTLCSVCWDYLENRKFISILGSDIYNAIVSTKTLTDEQIDTLLDSDVIESIGMRVAEYICDTVDIDKYIISAIDSELSSIEAMDRDDDYIKEVLDRGSFV